MECGGLAFLSYLRTEIGKRMLRIKKLDIFILKSFCLLFLGTFFICLFIFMMQFLWKYVDQMVGKGLDVTVLAQFFIYAGLTLVPASLPLAVLLAALITFGNFGERFELMAMKAAGVSLLQILRPLVVFIAFICVVSFYFQNVVGPYAQSKLWTLVLSMKQKSPELDIPEGAFYDQIPGYNLYVGHKNRDTGMLYDVLIYNFQNGFDNAQIIYCDSARMELTQDKQHLYLHLFDGEEFENLRSQTVSSESVPYRRESFKEKHALIEFDSSFNMMDEGIMDSQSISKNMAQLDADADSMRQVVDSMGIVNFNNALRNAYQPVGMDPTLKVRGERSVDEEGESAPAKPAYTTSIKQIEHIVATHMVNVDSIYRISSLDDREKFVSNAFADVAQVQADWSNREVNMKLLQSNMRRHQTAWHEKLTLSLACMIFLFIGVALGGIIRKGGLGMPVVISVLIFIFYYIVNNTGMKMAKEGRWLIWSGMWLSTAVLAPIGAYLTYKSNNDSVVINIDQIMTAVKKFFGIRSKRNLARKEVIIEDPDYSTLPERLQAFSTQCADYMEQHDLKGAPNYYKLWTNAEGDEEAEQINETLEGFVEEMSNTRSGHLLNVLNNYPILTTEAQERPFKKHWLNLACGIFVPLGLFFYIRIWIFRLRLKKDLETIMNVNKEAVYVIDSMAEK